MIKIRRICTEEGNLNTENLVKVKYVDSIWDFRESKMITCTKG